MRERGRVGRGVVVAEDPGRAAADLRVAVRIVAAGEGELEIGGVVLPAQGIFEPVGVGVVADLPLEPVTHLPAEAADEASQERGIIRAPDIRGVAKSREQGRPGGVVGSIDRDRGRDAERALEVEKDDDEIDALHRKIIQTLLDSKWTHGVETAIDMTLLGRYYERCADHAVSIARRVYFLVTGSYKTDTN